MTKIRLRLRAGAVVWQQTAVCEPELDAIAAVAGEVERWGGNLPFDTHALAVAVVDGRGFTLIAAPDMGVAWVASAALRPGDVEGRAVLVEPTPAYGARTRCEWRASPWDGDGLPTHWVEVDREPPDGRWLLLRRLVRGQPTGPRSRIAISDVLERWSAEDPDPPQNADQPELVSSLATDGSAIETLLRFLRMAPADGDAALPVTATESALRGISSSSTEEAAERSRSEEEEEIDALPWLEPGDSPAAEAPMATAGLPRTTLTKTGAPSAPLGTPDTIAAAQGPRMTRAEVSSEVSLGVSTIPDGMSDTPGEPSRMRANPVTSSSTGGTSETGARTADETRETGAQWAGRPSKPPVDAAAETVGVVRSSPSPTQGARDRRDDTPDPTPGVPDSIHRMRGAAAETADATHARPRPSGATSNVTGVTPALPPSGATSDMPSATPALPPPSSMPDTAGATHAQGAMPRTPGAAHAIPQPSSTAGRGPSAQTSALPSEVSRIRDALDASGAPGRVPGTRETSSAVRSSSATHEALGASSEPRAKRAQPDPRIATGAVAAIAGQARTVSSSRAPTRDTGSNARSETPSPRPNGQAARPGDAPVRSGDSAAPSSADPDLASPAARGRIAVARRGSDDPGLPALPAPDRRVEAPATLLHASVEPAALPRRSVELPSTRRAATEQPSTARAPEAGPSTVLPSPPAFAEDRRPSPPRQPDPVASGRANRVAAKRPLADVPRDPALAPVAAIARPVADATLVADTARATPVANTAPVAQRAAISDAPAPTGGQPRGPAPAVATTTLGATPEPGHQSARPSVPLESIPIATVIERAQEPLVLSAVPDASREISREIRVGDIFVELGEPMPPRQAVEHAGSLLASIPRPSFQPRRRL